jgi:hypothetical protein
MRVKFTKTNLLMIKNNLLFPDFLSAIQPETDGQGGIIIQGPVPVCPFAV